MRRLGNSDTLTITDSLKEALLTDWRKAALSEMDQLILAYVEKVTLEAHTIDQSYIDNLKANGLTDHMLHDIVQVTCYFAYVNRLADALGVELE